MLGAKGADLSLAGALSIGGQHPARATTTLFVGHSFALLHVLFLVFPFRYGSWPLGAALSNVEGVMLTLRLESVGPCFWHRVAVLMGVNRAAIGTLDNVLARHVYRVPVRRF